eukprot:GHVL01040826.1.p1 GENE.GHVL01040826.1~~GHVL01040826.1.p1  ORF type:complete len:404 (+),score=53.62 GHVL01040826.1:165-1376(+)
MFIQINVFSSSFSDVDDLFEIPDNVFFEHKNGVCCAHSYGGLAVTGGMDDVAYLWNTQTCQVLYCLSEHTDTVSCVRFSHDGAYIATGSYDHKIKLWEVSTGTCVQTLEGPNGDIDWLEFHPKGYALLSAANEDNTAWMWWAPTGKLMTVFVGHSNAVTCGGFGGQGKVVITGDAVGEVIVWDPKSADVLHRFPPQNKNFQNPAITCLTSHMTLPLTAIGNGDGRIIVVSTQTGKKVASLNGHSNTVESLQFGKYMQLASGSLDSKIIIWDLSTHGIKMEFDHGLDERTQLSSLITTNDENNTDHESTFSDSSNKDDTHLTDPLGGVVRIMWFFDAQKLCSFGTDGIIRVWDVRSGSVLRTLRGHTSTILDTSYSTAKDDKLEESKTTVVSVGEDGLCCVWQI